MSKAHKEAAIKRVATYPKGHMSKIRKDAWAKKTVEERKTVAKRLVDARKAKAVKK